MQREGFFDYNKPSALLFNLRMDRRWIVTANSPHITQWTR